VVRRWLRRRGRARALARRALRRVVVRGASMYPLLHPGDTLLFDRLAFRRRRPARGDVVLTHSPDTAGGHWIKLVAGLPGEHVTVSGDRLWIDGRPAVLHQPVVGSLPGRWTLGPTEYFLLSYALAVGTDSRHVGPLPRAALRGLAAWVLSPVARRRPLAAIRVPLDSSEMEASGR
jgi:signal peptidase I